MNIRDLTRAQLNWLNTQGGRDARHVEKDENGELYVLMYHPKSLAKQERIYIPKLV